MAEEPLVGGDADARALDLAALGLAAELPGHLAHLCERLRGDGLAEAGETTGRVDRDPAADGGVTGPQQRLGLAALAELQVLDPVQLQRGREVVDLGQADVGRVDARFLVRRLPDRLLEGPLRRGY